MTKVRARPSFSCMEVMSMDSANSGSSTAFCQYWKSPKSQEAENVSVQ